MNTVMTFVNNHKKLIMIMGIVLVVGMSVWGITAAFTPNKNDKSTTTMNFSTQETVPMSEKTSTVTCGDFAAELGKYITISENHPVFAMVDKKAKLTRLDMAVIIGSVFELSTAQVVDIKDKSSIDEACYKYVSDVVSRAIIPLVDGEFMSSHPVTSEEQAEVIVNLTSMKYLSTERVSVFAGSAFKGNSNGDRIKSELNAPIGIDFDEQDGMVISDNASNTLRQIKGNGMTQLGDAIAPRYVAVLSDGTAIYSGKNGIYREDGTEIAKGFNSPSEIVVINKENDFYVADTGNNCIKLVKQSGEVIVAAGEESEKGSFVDGTAFKARFNHPTGLALKEDGTLYISDSGNQRIRTLSNGNVDTVAGGGDVTDSATGFVVGGYIDGESKSARFNMPTGIDVTEEAVLFISDTGNNVIRAISENGTVTTVTGSGEAGNKTDMLRNSMYNMPRDVKYYKGKLYIADTNNNQIKTVPIDLNNIPKTVSAKNTEPQFNKQPEDITQARTVALFDFTGKVTVTTLGDREIEGYKGMRLKQGDRVTTDPGVIAQLDIDGNKVLTLNGSTVIELSTVSGDKNNQKTTISLLAGTIVNNVAKLGNNDYAVKTSKTTMGVRGTVFSVGLSDNAKGYEEQSVIVLEGTVVAAALNAVDGNGGVTQSDVPAVVEAMQAATFNVDNVKAGSSLQESVVKDPKEVQGYIDSQIGSEILNAIVKSMKKQSNTSPDLLNLISVLNAVIQRIEDNKAALVPNIPEPPAPVEDEAEYTPDNSTDKTANNETNTDKAPTGEFNKPTGNQTQQQQQIPNNNTNETSTSHTTSSKPSTGGGNSGGTANSTPSKPSSKPPSKPSSSTPSSKPDNKPPFEGVNPATVNVTKSSNDFEIAWTGIDGHGESNLISYKVEFVLDGGGNSNHTRDDDDDDNNNNSIGDTIVKTVNTTKVSIGKKWANTCKVTITPYFLQMPIKPLVLMFVKDQFPIVTNVESELSSDSNNSNYSLEFTLGNGLYEAAVYKENGTSMTEQLVDVGTSQNKVKRIYRDKFNPGKYYLRVCYDGNRNLVTRYDFIVDMVGGVALDNNPTNANSQNTP